MHFDIPRKRRKLAGALEQYHVEAFELVVEKDGGRVPLRKVAGNVNVRSGILAGFLLDEDDMDEEEGNIGLSSSQIILANGPERECGLESSHDEDCEEQTTETHPEDVCQDLVNTTLANEISPRVYDTARQQSRVGHSIRTCSGRFMTIREKPNRIIIPYERLVAARSTTATGRAQKDYYGIDIHRLMDDASKELDMQAALAPPSVAKFALPSIEKTTSTTLSAPRVLKTLMWTEKYGAKKFTDLVGDERTHRSVLSWLKRWDSIVFPHQSRPKGKARAKEEDGITERGHRKVLLLAGPPGLGKTTLAHVCARQAGYEVQEINASDERSRDVVKGRIRDMVGTESVRTLDASVNGRVRKAARPVCVIVDEVDGVVTGSGESGEGGFIKALVDLLALDQKNTNTVGIRNSVADLGSRQKRKGDQFRVHRPLILICNDVYHPSLRLLRQGTLSEIIHVRRPPLSMIIPRLQTIFEKEGIPCDGDGVRQLCEATWGVSNRKEDRSGSGGAGEGDMRGILVIGEWVARKLHVSQQSAGTGAVQTRLTKRWIEQNILGDLAHGGGAARSLGRGGSKDVVERVFLQNAGFPAVVIAAARKRVLGYDTTTASMADAGKKQACERLREMIESSAEDERIMTGILSFSPNFSVQAVHQWPVKLTDTDCFTTYPTHPFQDDTLLTKPSHAYDWLHFHATLSNLVHTHQEWELAPYLSSPILAFHHLFASSTRYPHHHSTNDQPNQEDAQQPAPFTGPRASFLAHESQKSNRATLQHLHSSLSPPLQRAFRSIEDLAQELLPYLLRILNPDVKPVVVGGSGDDKSVASVRRGTEKEMVRRGVDAMWACGVELKRGKVEFGEDGLQGHGQGHGQGQNFGGWVYRMEPPVDAWGVYETMERTGKQMADGKVRFAVRQVLEQEWKKEGMRREGEARERRWKGGEVAEGDEGVVAKMSGVGAVKQEVVSDVPVKGGKGRIKKDFFGRPLVEKEYVEGQSHGPIGATKGKREEHGRVWITYHEGFSNAVRKGITLKELLDGL